MKRLLVVFAAAGALVTTAVAPAFADAGPNNHNCEGAVNSGATPGFVSGGQQGSRTSERAQAGGQSAFVQAYNDQFANCGSTP